MLEVGAHCQHAVAVKPDPTVPDVVMGAYGVDGARIEALTGGRTNKTLRVQAGRDLVLQQMRGDAHDDLLGVMENLVRVTGHLDWRRLVDSSGESWYPVLVPTGAGRPFLMTDQGDVWRAFSYRPGVIVRSAQPRHTLASAAALYGRFTAGTADLGGPPLIRTAPDFHNLAAVWERFHHDLDEAPATRRASVEAEMTLIDELKTTLDRRGGDDGLRSSGDRVVHNDTKLSNVLFDRSEGHAIAVLDLDLVMMGPCWHDVGDLVRSASWHDGPRPYCSQGLFDTVVGAYVATAGHTLSDDEIATFALAGPRLSFELGLRYLNDHLRTEPALRVDGVDGHLARGLANMKLAAQMLGAYDGMRHATDDYIVGRRDRTKGTI